VSSALFCGWSNVSTFRFALIAFWFPQKLAIGNRQLAILGGYLCSSEFICGSPSALLQRRLFPPKLATTIGNWKCLVVFPLAAPVGGGHPDF